MEEDIGVEMKKKWDTWVATKGKDIVEKMKNWDTLVDATKGKAMEILDTWDAIMKDLNPYLSQVYQSVREQDESIIQDFHILKLFIIPKVCAINDKVNEDFNDFMRDGENAYSSVVADIIKVLHNSDKLDEVLEAQTQLMDYEKERIREEWTKQHAVETEGDENSVVVVVDSNMGQYLKAKFTELGKLKADILNLGAKLHEKMICNWELQKLLHLLRIQRIMCSQDDLCNEHKELIQNMIQNMMSAEDNSCSSTRVKKWHASSEDNIVASYEDEICRQKRLKL